MITRHGLWSFTVLAALVAASVPARAQGAADEAAAVALFDAGKKLAAAGDYAHACPKFLEVKRTLPTAGLLLNLGDCLEKMGKLASAWGEFKAAERTAQGKGDADRQGEAVRRAQAIEAKLSKLTVAVGDAERLPGLTVRRDGSEIGEGQWGAAVPVDAGEHVVEVAAPGFRAWSTRVTVGPEGATVNVAVPRLVPEAAGGAGAVGETAGATPFWSTQRTAGAAVGGVGVVGIVVGSVFGIQTLRKTSDAKGHCSTSQPPVCDMVGFTLENGAKTTANVSDVAFALAGAAAVTSVVLMVTGASVQAKSGAVRTLRLAPAVAVGTAGLTLRGEW